MPIALSLSAVADILIPPLCVLCDQCATGDAVVCLGCQSTLPRNHAPWCATCGLPDCPPGTRFCDDCAIELPAFAGARAPWRFEGPVRELIHALKYSGRRSVARWLAPEMLAAGGDLPLHQIDAVVPVPSHWLKRRLRGGDPAGWLAGGIAHALGRPLRRPLRRRRWTRTQTALDPAGRHRNVRGAFAVRGRAPRVALLIDDVLTSGATLHACALALRAAGAERVYALAAARTPRT